MAYINRFNRYHVACVSCSGTTTKTYGRANGGHCKSCVTGVEPAARARSHDDVLREGGYEDTMGCSPDVLEGRYDDGDY